MNDRRRQRLVRAGDRITDEAAVSDWLAAMRPAPRATVRRLSETELPTQHRRGRRVAA